MATADRDEATTAAICAAVLGAALAIGALPIAGGRAAFSVSVGATIAVGNLVMVRAIVRAVMSDHDEPPPTPGAGSAAESPPEQPEQEQREKEQQGADHEAEGRRGGVAWGAFALFKIFFLFGGIYLLLTKGLVDPLPLVVGYGVLPMGIAASAVLPRMRPRRR